ncbi:LysR family transcriptional regulator [Xylanibacillus composti]|uniref:LysR family transcriptional regulator n=1 Tax=Xylanibacillus composti TaxID=1572762 RepID=A0A8J4H705_9BACL|nr:LysR family transcriptional regulator [Xylanibacillus composti]GIQ69678.1 LysR family transcriptional regulator [Xylanibacillus composti]
MNLNKLEIVIMLAKHRKVSAAAEALGMKQPTVSFHMKSLEEHYGVRLFESRGGMMVLTEAGKALLHYATGIQALNREADRVLQEYREMDRGTLTIGASYVPGTYLLPGMISSFSHVYPGVTVKMHIKPAPVIRQQLHDHQIDIGFLSSLPFEDSELHTIYLGADDLVLVYSAAHPFAQLKHIDVSAIAYQPFIYHEAHSTTRQMTMQWAAAHQLNLRPSMELDSLEAIKRALLLGDSISFISQQAVKEEVDRGILACSPLPPPTQDRAIYACYRKDRWLSKGVQAFLDTARQSGGHQAT